ncbi:MAG: 4Fe-4S binding protein, partial [Oscillospiraceae bacterium]
MKDFFHSVTLDKDLCKGCINCIKRCPTEAIRVRDSRAHIIKERCIDCGECIRICPHHAKIAIYDPFSVLQNYEYTIALPPPSLYGQFNNLEDRDVVLSALLDIGFNSVYEVAKAAELISDATRRLLQTQNIPRPVISSACPAVTRL